MCMYMCMYVSIYMECSHRKRKPNLTLQIRREFLSNWKISSKDLLSSEEKERGGGYCGLCGVCQSRRVTRGRKFRI